jgi:hypothetical protein
MDAVAHATKATELIDEFADFVKVSSLYPANNERVQASLHGVLEKVEEIRGKRSRVRIRVVRETFAINNAMADSNKHNVEWLAECMNETALGGIAIEPCAKPKSLLAFSSLLRRNVTASRTATAFGQLWKETIPGVVLLERLFGISSERWEKLSQETRRILEEESSRGEVLREILEGDDATLDQALEIFEPEEDFSGDEFVDGVEFLRRMVETIPDNLHEDAEASIDLINMLMTSKGDKVADVERLSPELGQIEYRKMILGVSKHFYNGSEDSGEEASSLRRDSFTPFTEEPDSLEDELTAFSTALETLPNGRLDADSEHEIESWAEKLGIGLHRLLKLSQERGDTLAVERALAEQVEHAKGAKPSRLFRLYLERLCGPREGVDPWAHMRGLAAILESTGLLAKMIELRLVTAEILAVTFPQMFGTFVDSLGNTEEDNVILKKVCELVGTTRVLATELDMITSEQRARIYASKAVEAMPFAYKILQSAEQLSHEELEFVVSLRLENPECIAVRAIDDIAVLPLAYVKSVCELVLGLGGHAPTMRSRSESLIREYIANPPEGIHVDRVVRAIGALRAFWSRKTETFVRGLLKGTGFLRLKKPPKPIREALKTLLKTVKDEQDD